MTDSDIFFISKRFCFVCNQVFTGDLMKCPSDGSPLTVVSEPQNNPDIVPGFRLEKKIGQGATGMVYKAACLRTSEVVAVKILHLSLLNDLDMVKRFKQEAELTSQLSSPHIVAVKKFGLIDDGRPYMAMDYIDGSCVSSIIEDEGAMAPHRALPIFIQVAAGLAHAHAKGIMHRDIKLNNIMLIEKNNERDIVKIVDFGIAKQWAQKDGNTSPPLTLAGEAIGSPLYMSPEQCLGKTMDNRTDIYSLGSCMYEALTGRPLFTGENAFTIMTKHIHELPEAMDLPQFPAFIEIERIVFRALAKNPDERYATVTDLKSDLELVLRTLRPVNPPKVRRPNEAA
jgi:serine/threonine protein kinase